MKLWVAKRCPAPLILEPRKPKDPALIESATALLKKINKPSFCLRSVYEELVYFTSAEGNSSNQVYDWVENNFLKFFLFPAL